jgi:hypothetical protein
MIRSPVKVACISITALMLSAQTEQADQLDSVEQTALIIEASEFGCYRFDIYLALTREQQMRGLMFVRDLPQFTGMLFVYRDSGIRSIWMKNTFISLDILFVRANGTVESIFKNAEPQSLASMRSSEPVNSVLEVGAGVTKRLHIDTDSRLRLDLIQN